MGEQVKMSWLTLLWHITLISGIFVCFPLCNSVTRVIIESTIDTYHNHAFPFHYRCFYHARKNVGLNSFCSLATRAAMKLSLVIRTSPLLASVSHSVIWTVEHDKRHLNQPWHIHAYLAEESFWVARKLAGVSFFPPTFLWGQGAVLQTALTWTLRGYHAEVGVG